MWSDGKKRRLSWLRLLLTLGLIMGLGVLTLFRHDLISLAFDSELTDDDRWFAGYIDATLTPRYEFEKVKGNVILAFVVDGPEEGIQASWGGSYTLKQASDELDIDRRLALLRNRGYEPIVSFGGAHNRELALATEDVTELKQAYASVIDRYELQTIDLDLEEAGLTDKGAGRLRAKALKELQKEQAKKGQPLNIWLTLPVTVAGLTEDGLRVINEMLEAKVAVTGINLMTMNFGAGGEQSMLNKVINSLKSSHSQIKKAYRKAGSAYSDRDVWEKMGATPMIGENDTDNELFSLADAKALNQFAQEVQLKRLSMWSANRDRQSTANSIGTKSVSPYYSGVEQKDEGFANLLKNGFMGKLSASTPATPKDGEETVLDGQTDDPEQSPYEIWAENKAYLAETRVVWKQNVYQAKWWTKGEAPDTPTSQAEAQPWELLGPVLPGEKPVIQVKLPEDYYPAWDKTKIYHEGDRVLYQGNPYEARWWNQTENPEETSANENAGAWRALTETEIRQLLAE